MKKIISIMTFISLFGLKAQTLEHFFDEILENNAKVKAFRNKYSSSLQAVEMEGFLEDPKLNVGVFAMPVETKLGPQNFKISLSQKIPWFGTLSLKENIAKQKLENSYLELQEIINDLFYDFEKYYYQLLELNENYTVLKNNLDLLNHLKSLAYSKYKSGDTKLIDILRINIELEKAKDDINSKDINISYVKKKLSSILSSSEDRDFVIDERFYENNFDDNYLQLEDIIKNNLKLKMMYNQINIGKLNVDLAIKKSYPKFSLGLDYVFVGEAAGVENSGRDIIMPMLSFNIPLFYDKYSADKQKQTLVYDMKRNIRDDYVFVLESEYENALLSIRDAMDKIKLYQKNIKYTKQIRQLLTNDFINSNENFEDIIKAQQLEIKYQLLKSKAKKKYLYGLSKLKRLNSYNSFKKNENEK